MSIKFRELDDNEKLSYWGYLKLWWKHDGRYMHLEFKRGILNLYHWFPIIWKDRDWDYRYIYDLLRFKIDKQSEFIKKRHNHTRALQDASRMKMVTKLMKLVEDEEYSLDHYDYFDSEQWFEEFIDDTGKKHDTYILKTNTYAERFDDYFKKYPHAYREVTRKYPDEKEKERIARNMSLYRQAKAKRLLFKLLEHNIENWWD